MNFGEISQGLSSAINGTGDNLQQAMGGDMTNPQEWTKVQQYVAQYANDIGLESALISNYKQIIAGITQKM
ncbi:EscF/YscF/HrpA family type III secretion system needle major subunit [Paraburkholderia sediminicola]|uniref:EscF/YscF/HrpA family type III secretion system needle major subunit n=1 Tax=Paraburkholderia sediminicola TaxID=458836 RepID=UPI0038BB4DC9